MDNKHDEMHIDSFTLYESSEDGEEEQINGKKIINDFELYPEEDNDDHKN